MARWWRLVGWLTILSAWQASTALGGDWPQILGPQRNATATDEPLADRWPSGKLTPRWTYPIGQGYAGPAVLGDTVVVFHRTEDVDRIEALDRDTGKSRWRADFPTRYRGGIDSDHGPRCVPLIHRDAVYAFSAAGDLHCVALADGKTRWTRQLYEDFQGDEGYFGAGTTPLVAGDLLLINVGGRKSAGLVGLQLDTGKTAWQATDEAASYSAPTLATIDDKPIAIFVTRLNCVGVAPQSGQVVFKLPFGKRGPTVNAATPLVFENHLFLSASYGIGAECWRFNGTKPYAIWANDDTLSSQYATAAYREGFLYGTHGREDIGRAELRCVNAKNNGKVQWKVPDFGVANVIVSGDKLLALKTNGELVLARATPEKFESLASARITEETTRALPALAHGALFVRTNDGRGGGGRLLSVPVGATDKPR